MTRALVLAPWFPNRPGDRDGNFIYDSANALARAGVSVAVLVVRPLLRTRLGQARYRSLSGHFDAAAFPQFAEVRLAHYLSVPGSRLPRLSAWLHDAAVRRVLMDLGRSFKPTVIHAHTEGEAPVAVAVGKALGVSVVVTVHGINTAPRYFGSAYRRERLATALRAADRVVLVGKPLERPFAALVQNTDNFTVVPNGFTPPQLSPRRAAGSERTLRFVAVANLHPGKGIDIALQALANARARGLDDFTFTIVGDGAERPALEALAAELGLNDRVRFSGACAHAEIYAFLTQGDVFVLPSYREAFGVAYLEAMAAGLLAIGVEGQGPSAFIRDGETGFLIPPQNVEALADCLLRLARDRATLQRVASAGQRHVMQELTWAHHAERLAALYNDLPRQMGIPA
ncbi:MAG TPA: glycosyltransferase [Pseudolabrys sp.]|nr:glycosyltransferase [Pseudolabrys sp.]